MSVLGRCRCGELDQPAYGVGIVQPLLHGNGGDDTGEHGESSDAPDGPLDAERIADNANND